jgi:hypothetical protein
VVTVAPIVAVVLRFFDCHTVSSPLDSQKRIHPRGGGRPSPATLGHAARVSEGTGIAWP